MENKWNETSGYIHSWLLAHVDLSWLNCFLVDGQLNVFEGCMILVLWLKDCYFMVTVFISLHNQTVEIFRLNSTIQKLNSSCVGRGDTIWNYLDFVAIFVAFASSWWFYTDCNFSLTRPCDMKNSLQSNTTFSCSIIPLYCNWKSITSMWCEN